MEALESSFDFDYMDLECVRRVKNSVKEDVSLLKSHPGSWDCGGRGGRDARLRRLLMNQDEFRVVQSVSLPQAQHPTVEISLCSDEYYYDDSVSSSTTLRDSCDVSSGSSFLQSTGLRKS
jgi:hypothetical protein